MQKRRRITFGAAALALLTAAPAMGAVATASAASASSPVSFTYWTSGWKPSEIATLDSAFDKAYPQYQAKGQYISTSDTYLPKVIAALKTNTQPTVYTDQQPYDLPIVQESGKLIPLTGKMTGRPTSFTRGSRSRLFYRGQQLGMALGESATSPCSTTRPTLPRPGSPSPPTTWAQLAADAAKLTVPRPTATASTCRRATPSGSPTTGNRSCGETGAACSTATRPRPLSTAPPASRPCRRG